ncbi:hypothetical protein HY409_04295 [Candidatus Gottesmanbacteria bacterium]|nr:hypothetical protein [Candidatus Gottesmanbacteria bacterium]
MNHLFEELYTTIWKQVFALQPALDLAVAKELFTKNLALPQKHSSLAAKTPVYMSDEYGYNKFISQEETEKRSNTDNFMEKTIPIRSLPDVLAASGKIALFRASRAINSEILEESDDIYSSSYIYNSTHIYNSQKLMYCYNTKTCEYLFASKGSADSTFGIRIFDSGSVSNSFDVHWSGKCANSYFCHDCYDLRDCMFCFHLTSKQYCIANMQFTEEEYEKLKAMILTEYFAQLQSPKAFVLLNQL